MPRSKLQRIASKRNWRIPWIKGIMGNVRIAAKRVNAFDLLSDIQELENELYQANNRHWRSKRKKLLDDD